MVHTAAAAAAAAAEEEEEEEVVVRMWVSLACTELAEVVVDAAAPAAAAAAAAMTAASDRRASTVVQTHMTPTDRPDRLARAVGMMAAVVVKATAVADWDTVLMTGIAAAAAVLLLLAARPPLRIAPEATPGWVLRGNTFRAMVAGSVAAVVVGPAVVAADAETRTADGVVGRLVVD